jgi:hypothetical protein
MSAAFDLDYQYCKIHLRVRHFQAQPQDSNFKTKFKGGGQECPPHTVSGFARLLPLIYTSSFAFKET